MHAKWISCIEFVMEHCTVQLKFVITLMKDKKLFHLKISKLGQILRVDKTGLLRPGYIDGISILRKLCTKIYILI